MRGRLHNMTLIKPTDVDAEVKQLVTVSIKLLKRAILGVERLVVRLEQDDFDAGNDVKAKSSNLTNAAIALMKEHQRVVDESKKLSGIDTDFAVDMQSARDEIGSRLARLRSAGED